MGKRYYDESVKAGQETNDEFFFFSSNEKVRSHKHKSKNRMPRISKSEAKQLDRVRIECHRIIMTQFFTALLDRDF